MFRLLSCFPPTALNGFSCRKRCKVGLRQARTPCLFTVNEFYMLLFFPRSLSLVYKASCL